MQIVIVVHAVICRINKLKETPLSTNMYVYDSARTLYRQPKCKEKNHVRYQKQQPIMYMQLQTHAHNHHVTTALCRHYTHNNQSISHARNTIHILRSSDTHNKRKHSATNNTYTHTAASSHWPTCQAHVQCHEGSVTCAHVQCQTA